MKYFGLLGAIVAFGCVTPVSATILTFNGTNLGYAGQLTTYGSNMTATCTGSGQTGCADIGNGWTPDIAVSYLTSLSSGDPAMYVMANHMYFVVDLYADLTNVATANNGNRYSEVTLTPQSGKSVKLNGFDLAGIGFQDQTGQTIRVYNADYSQVLANLDGTVHGYPAPYHNTYSNMNIVSSTAVHIQFGSGDLAIDNVNFDETSGASAPEPAAFALAGFGGVLLAAFRRLAKS